jgi:hypothetical protein
MVLEITHRVVQYSVVQKITEQVGEPLLENIYKPKLNLPMDANLQQKEQKCSPVANERCVHSRELFPATIPPQEVCDSFEKLLTPQV